MYYLLFRYSLLLSTCLVVCIRLRFSSFWIRFISSYALLALFFLFLVSAKTQSLNTVRYPITRTIYNISMDIFTNRAN